MNPWTIYLFNQFDTLLLWSSRFAVLTWVLILVALVIGTIAMAGEKLEAANFIFGQQLRHFAFKLVPLAIILMTVAILTPTSRHACTAHPHCVWK